MPFRRSWRCRSHADCSASTPTCQPRFHPSISKAFAFHEPPPADLTADERNAWEQLDFFYKKGLGYALEMANRPQTLYVLLDSPLGLAAWMLDHDARSQAMIARVFDGKPEGLTRDDVLDNVRLYWLTSAGISSARLYWDTAQLGAALIAHTCIEATVRFAAELGYDVTVVSDATADYSNEEMHAALDINIPNYGSAVMSTEEIVAALSGLEGLSVRGMHADLVERAATSMDVHQGVQR